MPFVASTPIACPRETTDKRRTTTTNSSSSHHHYSAPSRPHSLICTGAEPIHPVHASSQLCRAAVALRNEVILLPFWRGSTNQTAGTAACNEVKAGQLAMKRLFICPQQIPDLYIKAPRSWLSVYTRSPDLLNSCFALPDGLRCRCPAHLFRDEH